MITQQKVNIIEESFLFIDQKPALIVKKEVQKFKPTSEIQKAFLNNVGRTKFCEQ